jgi:hypothetical protein
LLGVYRNIATEQINRIFNRIFADVICGNGEKEREGCCIERATENNYIHKRAE